MFGGVFTPFSTIATLSFTFFLVAIVIIVNWKCSFINQKLTIINILSFLTPYFQVSYTYLLSQISILAALGQTRRSWEVNTFDKYSQQLDDHGEKQNNPVKENIEERSYNNSR